MATEIYQSLRSGLTSLASSLSSQRDFSDTSTSVLPALPPTDLAEQVKHVWERCNTGGHTEGSASGPSTAEGRKVEVIRSVLELVGKDVVVGAIVGGEVSWECPR
jgi:hypothetical protein